MLSGGVMLSRGRGFGKHLTAAEYKALASQAKAAGTTTHQLLELMEKLGVQPPPPHFPKYKPPTREELLERKKNNRHGPYGGGYDRRGRKL